MSHTDDLTEHYLKLVVPAITQFRRIEALIADLQVIEEKMDHDQYVTTIHAFESSMVTLQANFETAIKRCYLCFATVQSDVKLLLFAITLYRSILKEKGLDEGAEKLASKATILHLHSVQKRERLRRRKVKLKELETNRQGRVKRSEALQKPIH